MKRFAIGGGVYQSDGPRHWARPWINHRRTWRLLKATTRKAAFKEAANLNPISRSDTFATLARLYVDRHCPDATKTPRDARYVTEETARVEKLIEYFGRRNVSDPALSVGDISDYRDWRRRHSKSKQPLDRSVDKESQTLSNVFRFGLVSKLVLRNPYASGRPSYYAPASHARDWMPASADVIHELAGHFFESVRTEVHGWHCYLAMFTGCRTSELLRLRLNARQLTETKFEAGFHQPDFDREDISTLYADTVGLLHLQRSKAGINPWALVGPDFAQMLDCHQRWHTARFGEDNPYYIPSPYGGAMGGKQFGRALTAACRAMDLPKITPHGFRAYYATKRRRDLIPDPFVAAELGDKTVALISTTYGRAPGRGKLRWLPKEGLPGWLRWSDARQKVVRL